MRPRRKARSLPGKGPCAPAPYATTRKPTGQGRPACRTLRPAHARTFLINQQDADPRCGIVLRRNRSRAVRQRGGVACKRHISFAHRDVAPTLKTAAGREAGLRRSMPWACRRSPNINHEKAGGWVHITLRARSFSAAAKRMAFARVRARGIQAAGPAAAAQQGSRTCALAPGGGARPSRSAAGTAASGFGIPSV